MSQNFKEKIAWPFWLWLFLLFLAASLALAFWAALGNLWAALSMIVQLLGLLLLSRKSLLEVSVEGDWLHVGRAKIDRTFIVQTTDLDSVAMRALRGPRADPASYVQIRFWIPAGIKIEISDPEDSTPYWLVSSKKAQLLAAALS